MFRLALFIAMLFPPTLMAANFTGERSLVEAAEKARTASAIFWTGSDLPEWSEPCPISWERGPNESGSGSTFFSFENGEVFGFRMEIMGPMDRTLRNVIPHEVDHAVRASIVRKKIPRWLDEGCAVQFESEKSKAGYRSALIYGDLRHSAWNMFHLTDYPQSSEEVTAMYSGSASIVEWMLEKSSPQDVLKLQYAGPITDDMWLKYIGEPKQNSRKRYEEWFAAKYSGDTAPKGHKFIDVWIAGDFDCPPCHSFMEYARSTTPEGRGFLYHIYRLSREDCAKQGLSVPMFSSGKDVYSGPIGDWGQIDEWARKKLNLPNTMLPPPVEPPSAPAKELPPTPITSPQPSILPPGVTASPEALAILAGVMAPPPKYPSDEPLVDWSGILVIVAASEDVPRAAGVAEGPGRRAVQRLTKGKATIQVISERVNPVQFSKYEKSLGLDIDMFHISILVPETDTVLPIEFMIERAEVILHNTVKNFAGVKVVDIPVEPILEDILPEKFVDLESIAFDVDTAEDSSGLWVTENIKLSGVAIIGLVVGFILRRRKKSPVAATMTEDEKVALAGSPKGPTTENKGVS